MIKRGLLIASAALLLAFGAAWLARDEAPSGLAVTPAQQPGEMPLATLEEALQEQGKAAPAAEIDARAVVQRLKQAPEHAVQRAVDAPATDERDITAENIDHMVQSNLEYALLQGDVNSGYFVTRARMTCERFAGTPEELERAMQRVHRRVERERSRGRDFPGYFEYDQPWSFTGDMEANRIHLERWYDACQRLREIFTPDLRRQLQLQALDGNAVARYLYATWPEELRADDDAFERQFRWEDQAREFSLANLYGGEVAGMLAFGHSYMTGLFTARNGELSMAFGIAALNCGFEIVSVRSFLASRIERLTSSEDPADLQRLQLILEVADRLGRFCPS